MFDEHANDGPVARHHPLSPDSYSLGRGAAEEALANGLERLLRRSPLRMDDNMRSIPTNCAPQRSTRGSELGRSRTQTRARLVKEAPSLRHGADMSI